MKAFKRSMSILLAFGLLISSLFIGGDIKRVRAASVSYVEIKYGDDTSGNWGYILVPKVYLVHFRLVFLYMDYVEKVMLYPQ